VTQSHEFGSLSLYLFMWLASLCSVLFHFHFQFSILKRNEVKGDRVMGGACSSNAFSAVQSTISSRFRSHRAVSLFSVRACVDPPRAPSCIYVGPLHTATKETLEALYSQVTRLFNSPFFILNFTYPLI